jgi:hypothetical protein
MVIEVFTFGSLAICFLQTHGFASTPHEEFAFSEML